MILNEYGKIAYNEWFKTPNIRSNIQLDVFIVKTVSGSRSNHHGSHGF
jgi:hypothetical protein